MLPAIDHLNGARNGREIGTKSNIVHRNVSVKNEANHFCSV